MLTVSNYHYIREEYKTAYPSVFGVTPVEFTRQLRKIENLGDVITPLEFLANFDDVVSSKDNFFFITFDDGLKEQFEYAIPILEELNMQAIFFANSINSEYKKVSTVHKIHLLRSVLSPQKILSYLEGQYVIRLSDKENRAANLMYRFDNSISASLKYLLNFKIPFREQEQLISSLFEQYFCEQDVLLSLYMSDNELQYLAVKSCLGCHTHSHYPLGLLGQDKLNYELEHSKTFFENLTKKSIQMVAYPYGTEEACTDLVAETAKKIGYLYGFTTKKGVIDHLQNKLLLNRFDCNDLVGGKNYKL